MDQEQINQPDEELVRQVVEFRSSIVSFAEEKQYNFDVVFTTLNQVAAAFAYDWLFLTEGAVTAARLRETINVFSLHTQEVAAAAFENMQAAAEAVRD